MNLNRTVLIIENDKNSREGYATFLESEGFHTLEACDGKTALELLLRLKKSEYPKCIIIDLIWPKYAEREFLIQMNLYRDTFGNIPLILSSMDGQNIRNFPFFGKLQKPFSLELLVFEVQKAMAS